MAQHLDIRRDGGVLRVTLNRPELRNAFNDVLIDELLAALADASSDDDVRVVVLGGAGKSFCAGADLAWMKSMAGRGDAANAQDAVRLAGLFDAVERCPKPVIGRIHGAAIGGGVGLVAACDIPVAEAGTVFAFSEVRLGLAPAVISPYVVRKIGAARAREWFVTGARFGAVAAERMGLVHYVEEGEPALDVRVDALARSICEGGPRAVTACKQLALTVAELSAEDALASTSALIASLRASPEGQEGMRAFLTKSPPAWKAKGQP